MRKGEKITNRRNCKFENPTVRVYGQNKNVPNGLGHNVPVLSSVSFFFENFKIFVTSVLNLKTCFCEKTALSNGTTFKSANEKVARLLAGAENN